MTTTAGRTSRRPTAAQVAELTKQVAELAAKVQALEASLTGGPHPDAAAQRVYEDSVRKGRPLSAREVARSVGCSPTTAWRAIRAVKQARTSDAASPNEAPPSDDVRSAEIDTLVEV